VRLAESEACAQQAFAWDGNRVLGLQFHLEVTYDNAVAWFRHECISPARYVQTPEQILAERKAFDANNDGMRAVLAQFL
jgi:GMP synthase-like glutamine amidotransferase